MTLQSFRRYLLDRLVLRPSRHPIDPGEKQRVMVSLGQRAIECFVHRRGGEAGEAGTEAEPPDPPEVLVLKFPGTAGRAERSSSFPLDLLPPAQQGGPATGEVWTWNPPGYGRSDGTASLQNIAEGALALTASLVSRRVGDRTRVVLCGNSLGCAAALYAASRGLVPSGRSGLVLRNPPPLMPVVRRVASRYPLGRLLDPVTETLCESMNAVTTAGAVALPIVFLQCTEDTLVPPGLQHLIHQSHHGPQRIVDLEGLDHDGLPDATHEEQIAEALRWLWKQVAAPDTTPHEHAD